METKDKAIVKKIYTEEQWKEVKDLVIYTDKTFREISDITGIPATTIETKSMNLSWLNKRDKNKIEAVNENLNRIIQQIGFQINDLHQHAVGLTEAVLKAYQVEIVRDNSGNIHYRNTDDSADKPPQHVWQGWSQDQKDIWYDTIAPIKLSRLTDELERIQNMKRSNIEFITKMIKGSLPKIDPFVLDISRRDAVIDTLEDSKIKEEK